MELFKVFLLIVSAIPEVWHAAFAQAKPLFA